MEMMTPAQEATPRRLVTVGRVIFALALAAVAAVVVPNVMDALSRGKQKRTMGDMRTIATAIESYSIDHHDAYPITRAPAAAALEEVVPLLVPTYVKEIPRVDGWGRPFELESTAKEYTITSRGSDGRPDMPDGPSIEPNGGTTDFRNDIIFSTGSFAQFPDGGGD
jgi:general secretion pathway protein G